MIRLKHLLITTLFLLSPLLNNKAVAQTCLSGKTKNEIKLIKKIYELHSSTNFNAEEFESALNTNNNISLVCEALRLSILKSSEFVVNFTNKNQHILNQCAEIKESFSTTKKCTEEIQFQKTMTEINDKIRLDLKEIIQKIRSNANPIVSIGYQELSKIISHLKIYNEQLKLLPLEDQKKFIAEILTVSRSSEKEKIFNEISNYFEEKNIIIKKPFLLKWHCKQTYPNILPEKTVIPITNQSGVFDLTALNQMLELALIKDPTHDFYPCFLSLYNQLVLNTALEPFYYQIKNSFADLINLYAARAHQKQAISTIHPGEFLELSDHEKFKMKEKIILHCRADDARFLAKNFITELSSLFSRFRPSASCLKNIEYDYAKILIESELSDQECQKNKSICQKRQNEVRQALKLLGETRFESLRSFTEDENQQLACVPDDQQEEFLNKNILSLMKLSEFNNKLEKGLDCKKIKNEGQSLLVDYTPDYKTHDIKGHSAHYAVTRIPSSHDKPASYLLTLNLEFLSDDPKTIQKMQQRVQACYNQIKGRIKDQNGQSLEIALSSHLPDYAKDLHIPKPRVERITLDLKNIRSSAHHWEKDIECHTILHESLHLVGLVDEYIESEMSTVVDRTGKKIFLDQAISMDQHEAHQYNCRIQGPEDSIMQNSILALKRKESILYPAQFRQIIEPGCHRLYYLCSAKAYQTSFDHFGLHRCGTTLPKECYNKEWITK